MKAPRILSRRENEVARLAAERTKDDAIAIILEIASAYDQDGASTSAMALKLAAERIFVRLPIYSVVTEL